MIKVLQKYVKKLLAMPSPIPTSPPPLGGVRVLAINIENILCMFLAAPEIHLAV